MEYANIRGSVKKLNNVMRQTLCPLVVTNCKWQHYIYISVLINGFVCNSPVCTLLTSSTRKPYLWICGKIIVIILFLFLLPFHVHTYYRYSAVLDLIRGFHKMFKDSSKVWVVDLARKVACKEAHKEEETGLKTETMDLHHHVVHHHLLLHHPVKNRERD